MVYVKPARRPRGELASRLIDFTIAVLAIATLAPAILLRAVAGRRATGRWLEWTPALGRDCSLILLCDFTGPGPGRRLAWLFNLLRGDVALAGPRPALIGERGHWLAAAPSRFWIRPGLVSTQAPAKLTGVAVGSEAVADREFTARYGPLSGLALLGRWLVARCMAGPAGSTPPSLRMLGLTLANTTMDEAVRWLAARARSGRRTTVAFANPDCFNIAHRDRTYRRVLQEADRVFGDGIGLRIAGRILGQKMADNVNGTDLFPRLCSVAAREGLRLFLLGARPGLAERTAEAMRERCPGLIIAGTHHGYFAAAETDAVIDRINRSGADILLVAMGAPHQELWLARHEAALRPAVRIGVGGLFDFYSGRIPRAPSWMREAGLEWVWRLICEPSRLWRRYLLGNPLFLARVLRERVIGGRSVTARAIQPDGRAARALASLGSRLRRRAPALRDAALAAGKRALDVLGSGLAIVALSPALAATALLVRVESPGPVVFRQQRVGRHGRLFTMFKFRSMYVDAEARRAALLASNEMAGGVTFKMKHDPRVTRVGRFIRRTSIDELPQLFNVLLGDMSLVGPRPPLPSEVAQYTPRDRGRLDAAPGITCIWQVSGRSEIPFDRQVEMDLDYIHGQSLTEDVRLLLKTVPALVRGHGAY